LARSSKENRSIPRRPGGGLRTWGARPPLFEKERHVVTVADVTKLAGPAFLHGPSPRPALPPDDGPRDTLQIDIPDRPEQRLERDEACVGVDLLQVLDPARERGVLDRDSEPDVARDRPALIPVPDIVAHERAALGQHLVDMPVRLLHRIEHLVDELTVDVLVEQVAHRVHEDHPRLLPERGLFQSRRPERQVESLLVGMSWNAPPTLSEAFGVAVVTARTDLGAARHRVPRRIRPFNV
jgi:hypothetical protein